MKRAALAFALMSVGAGLVSCTVESTTRLRTPGVETSGDGAKAPSQVAGESRRSGNGGLLDKPIATRAGESFSARIVAEVQPRGTIPYDNMTLPLVSPDGLFLATQTGFPPTWDTVLAEPGATVPATTRIEIYELPFQGNDPPVLRTVVAETALLGRGADQTGFLVESPRADGARWIGHADWVTGKVKWLVAEPDTVAAFATIGAGGRLAYSSRPVGTGEFDLVVRQDGTEFRLPGNGGDWLMPTWASSATNGAGDGLFALLLRGDMLDAVHMIATDGNQMRRTLNRSPLASSGATRDGAFQTLNATVTIVGAPAPKEDRLFFFHPAGLRAATWTPPATPALLDRGSFTAVTDPGDPASVIVVTQRDLLRRQLANENNRSKLIAGTQVPRVTASEERPFVLLQPADGVIGLTVMRLLPASALVDE